MNLVHLCVVSKSFLKARSGVGRGKVINLYTSWCTTIYGWKSIRKGEEIAKLVNQREKIKSIRKGEEIAKIVGQSETIKISSTAI